MKFSFDLDGTICDGRYLQKPIDTMAYQALDTYDLDTRCIWNKICNQHEVYIITSRSYLGAAKDVGLWLVEHDMEQPCGIITMAPPTKHADKAKLIDPIGVWAHFDDSPEVCSAILNETHAIAYLMNNPGWEANQECRSRHCRVTSWSQIENIIASYTH